jgi:GDP-4-dehydro-6-deoxy-D-mannose reductase
MNLIVTLLYFLLGDLKNMKVLVTGAAGFVGPHLIKELNSNSHEAISVINLKEQAKVDVKNYKADLLDASSVNKINFAELDAVIHLAGLAAVGPSFEEPMRYINTNIGIEINLFEVALKQNAKIRFLIISSGALYDPKSPLPLNEKSKVSPSSPYAVSKIGQEKMAEYYGSRGFEYIIARPFNHIGPGQNEGFIVPDLAKQIVKAKKDKNNTVKVGNLEAKRDYTDVRDIVRAYRLLLEKGKSGEIYNVCSGKSYSGQEILNGLLEFSNTQPKIVKDQARMRPSDNPDIFGDNSKIHKDTGWKPEIKIQQTLKDAIKDWQARLN